MRIAVIGTGYVGLVTGTCFAELGHHVTCVDKDEKKITNLKSGVIPIFEPGLEALVLANVKASRLHFTTMLADALKEAEVVFIAVGTPTGSTAGEADLSYIFNAAKEIGATLTRPILVITKSTVPVGTGRKITAIIKETNSKAVFEIASNPEFLREGFAIDDFMHPDRIVAGCDSEKARSTISELYKPLMDKFRTTLLFTGVEAAEMIKYASNTFLATKLAFINEMADVCEKLGADITDVARGMGMDSRIGSKFLNPGPGFGGSCFPKDTLALIKTAEDIGVKVPIMHMMVTTNESRKLQMAQRVVDACGGSLAGKTVAVWGLTFKANTDDMRNSPSLPIVNALLETGAQIRAYDPQGMEEAKHMLKGNITWCKDAYDAAEDADVIAIITEWDEFKKADMEQVKRIMKQPVIVDMRNLYTLPDMQLLGFTYISLGRKVVSAS